MFWLPAGRSIRWQLIERNTMDQNKLLVIGDANIDIIINGLEHMPEMGKEVFVDNVSMRVGGGAANVAFGLTNLNCSVMFCGALGNDLHGRYIEKNMMAANIDITYLAFHNNLPTGISVSISNGDDRLFISSMGANSAVDPTHICSKTLHEVSHVHISICDPRQSLEPYINIAEQAHNHGCTVSLDIGWTDDAWDTEKLFNLLELTDVFFPNICEARCICGYEASIDELGSYLLKFVRDIVVVTCGADGATAFRQNERRSDKYEADAVDSVGAGDAFDAGFLCAYVERLPLSTCLAYGCACGSIAVSRIGGGSTAPSKSELLKAIALHKANDLTQ